MLVNPLFVTNMLSLHRNCSTEQVRERIGSLAYDHTDHYGELAELVGALSRVQNWPNEAESEGHPVSVAMHDTCTLLALLDRLFSTEGAKRTATAADSPVKRAIAVIEGNFQKPITLQHIAKASSTSKYHLCRLFKAQTGVSLWTFVNTIRIRHATTLLSSGSRNVTEACFECGFTDPSYFAKVFRQHLGVAPKKWVNHLANQMSALKR
jgi:AraC-like DNA-binding protein